MNKNIIMVISIAVSLSAIIFIPVFVKIHASGGIDAIILITLSIISFISSGLTMFLESKKDKPNLGNIAAAAVLNAVGLGVAVYMLLSEKYKSSV